MTMIEIDETELNATREQAASAIVYKNEAERLAVALHQADPNSRLLRSEIWQDFFTEREKRATEPERLNLTGVRASSGFERTDLDVEVTSDGSPIASGDE